MVVEDITGGYAQHTDAPLSEPFVATDVVSDLIWMVMRDSVDLDRKSGGCAIEVQDIGPDGMLAPKAQSADATAAQCIPEGNFRQGHVAA
jgi:hypothetical protein